MLSCAWCFCRAVGERKKARVHLNEKNDSPQFLDLAFFSSFSSSSSFFSSSDLPEGGVREVPGVGGIGGSGGKREKMARAAGGAGARGRVNSNALLPQHL
jgi:hypothetical protein